MPFDQFMMSNYVPVCTRLNGFLLDEQMKEMIRTGEQDSMLVKSWMRGYGLFQGIRSEQREQIAAGTQCRNAEAAAGTASGIVSPRHQDH